ncbi:MAG: DUF58 domain-containing protein [Blastocatellia bacterium]|nr:DUF58 domain-containing protein [Blastocatellia bacterium]
MLINFIITSLLLGGAIVSLFVAIMAQSVGEPRTAEVLYLLSLVLGVAGGIYSIPILAKRVQWDFLQFNLSYTATTETAFFLTILLVVGIAAVNTGNNLLYLIFSILVGLILTSGVVSHNSLRDIDVGLRFPDHIYAKQEVHLDITVTNHKHLVPSFSLMVGVEIATRKGKTGFRAKMRELFGLLDKHGLSQLAHFIVVPRRQRLRQTIPYAFQQRGRYVIKGFVVSTKFPFGFVQKTRHIEAHGELIVYPEIESRRDILDGLSTLTGNLEHLFKGTGAELYAIRQYQTGDNLRHIDWKATAKTRRTMVKEFTREDERRVTIFFDTMAPAQPSPEFNRQFEQAVSRAATIAFRLVDSNIQVRLVTPTSDSGFDSSHEHLHKLLHELALIRFDNETDTSETPRQASNSEFLSKVVVNSSSGILFTHLQQTDDRLARFVRFGKVVSFSSLSS